ncbi:hypothetical protein FOMPIDRAFT_1020614 [Fomitopsis schrenkii]|uniref:Uncharacterized protein n=1 Tax=Fomitopsis schrenkii TaxID=2126942 RepID=S8F349_FOMSC|nr:hypothetical protein FOMPIDRAFT_1020614 [Fomitopsis schrenkii]
MADFTQPNARPSLPPLHTLGLPYPLVRSEQPAAYDSYDSDNDRLSPETMQPGPARPWARGRQSSVSSTTSSCTAPSRSGSPTDAPPLAPKTIGFTLLLTTMDKADALIVVPQVPPVPQLPSPPPSPSSQCQSVPPPPRTIRPLLITGPMVNTFKQNHTRISRIARMHPYRMVPKIPSAPGSRRPSLAHPSLMTAHLNGRP